MRIHLLTNTFIWLYAVFGNLISHILDRAEPLLSSSLSLEVITVFQYYSYLANKNVSDLANYLLQLAREALMAQTLQSLRDEKFLQNKAYLTSISLSPEQEVLKSLAVLLTENKRETYEAVVTILSAAAAENKHFREKMRDNKLKVTTNKNKIELLDVIAHCSREVVDHSVEESVILDLVPSGSFPVDTTARNVLSVASLHMLLFALGIGEMQARLPEVNGNIFWSMANPLL
ncbi:rho family-interacting cell polarization regulator 2-like [Protobothrops mucrosquamatus]|uniref:rho family-interacting cell polarization regulator 2-like n=1 Tax=Protobothrops mucrosquamatus TaxID=103944 RepID=UPI000775A4DF|nr:rho family-interacting cell polarization regulator 2-like [Protobothrops mucrosquamatus]